MAEKIKEFVEGHKTWEVSVFNTTFKNTMIQLLQGYPVYEYFGIWETYFGKELGGKVVDRLEGGGLLMTREDNGQKKYSLTPEGVKLAVSLLTKRKVDNLKYVALVLIGLTIIVGVAQLFLSYLQHPIF